jgi:HEAT repeat protein
LEQTFALVLESSGKVARFGGSRALSAGTESLLRAAVSSLQYVAAPAGGDKTWQTVEADHYGTFTANYRALAHNRVEKQKAYTKLAMPELMLGADLTKSTARGFSSYELAEQGHWPTRVESKDELDTGTLRVAQRFTLTLQHQRPVQRQRADLSGTRMTALAQFVEREGDGRKSIAYLKRIVGGASYRELANELAALGTSEEDDTKRDKLVRRLSALFELDPAAVRSAAREVRDQGPGAKELLGALTSSAAKEARSALNQLAADRSLPTQLRQDVLADMTIQARPTAETFTNLTTLMNDPDPRVRNGAVLALGSAAESAGSDPAQSRDAERANRSLSQGYESAQTPAERSLFLKALGNSGSPQALEAAKNALASPDPAVRREGARALRLVPGDEADQLIAQVWQLDEDASVRDGAAFSAGYRPLSPVLAQAALNALTKDPDATVRLRTLAILGENLAGNPAFAQAIRKTAQEDPIKDVRDAALRYLRNT